MRSVFLLAAALSAAAAMPVTGVAPSSAQTDSIPSPSLPYVGRVVIESTSGNLLICPNDSIRVKLAGVFPDHCYSLEGIEVAESFPPSLNIHVARACSTACALALKPWNAEVLLPPMPIGNYSLRIAVRENPCPSGPDTTVGNARFPFFVERCRGLGDCFIEGWAPGPDSTSYCHARIGPGGSARVIFTLWSQVGLAGLQGRFAVSSPALRIAKIETTWATDGMHVTWTPTAQGASFVMFGGRGIPPCPDSIPPNVRMACPTPALALTLEPTGKPLPSVTSVTAYDLLGSDVHGAGVERCPIMTLVPIDARICSDGGCDINADGRLDIRDIVIQAQCLADRDTTILDLRVGCPTDCNRDGSRNLDDVLCCARQILLGPPCLDCPPDTTAPVLVPHVRVMLGDVAAAGDLLTVPFWVDGLWEVGGALLAFEYPQDRYDAVVRFADGSSGWLRLQEIAGGEARVGLLRVETIAGIMDAPPQIGTPTSLELTLKPGHAHGGRVAVRRAEFSGPKGERLEANPSLPSVSLGLKPTVALSEPRPNPTTRGATVTLSLSLAANAVVQVYDLTGRAVATVHRGSLPAGVHELTWNGRRDGGESLNAGIYFMRATAGGVDATRKIVVLGR